MNLATRIETVPFTSYTHFDVNYEINTASLWYYLRGDSGPFFTSALLKDIEDFQQSVVSSHSFTNVKPEFLVMASHYPGIFNLGGDLKLIRDLVINQNKEGLKNYATTCLKVLYANAINLDLPLTTIALVQGDAYGGGFEAALSCSVIVAERGVKMGLPEILYNLFPGIGSYSLLSRRIGLSLAERIITSGQLYTAEQLYELGVVDILAEPGEGVSQVHDYIRRHQKISNGFAAIQKVRNYIQPISYAELEEITGIWIDTAMNLSQKDLRVIDRLIAAQDKKLLVKEKPQMKQNRPCCVT